MNPIAIVALVAELVGEGAKLIMSAIDASREQIVAVEAMLRQALDDLRATRLRVEREITARHEETQAAIDAAKVAVEFEAVKAAALKLDPNELAALRAALAEPPGEGGPSER